MNPDINPDIDNFNFDNFQKLLKFYKEHQFQEATQSLDEFIEEAIQDVQEDEEE